MRIDIMTLFPEMCDAVLGETIIGRARKAGLLDIALHNIRDHTQDKHRRVDDYPYGGGAGMVMQAPPVVACFEHVARSRGGRPHLIYMSPRGAVLTQARAAELSKMPGLAILCGHYEGVDQRAIDLIVDEELSIGDYVVTGGELPALVLCDAVCRLVPGVLDENAHTDESHYDGLLEYPQYTRPPEFRGVCVPPVLLSGNHAEIDKWRAQQALEVTRERRPDLL